ncbi:hypothetical protein HQQ81_01210 [Microbacteriaceae bacterium VKM Ac-2854]|nr:hypothetical protein [Microbacteriaceae bacterium VKM Ac-2854]
MSTSLYVRIPRLLIGLAVYGFADALMIRAVIGVDPWTVFAQGFVNVTGLGFGLLTNIIGLLVLLLWIPLKQKPGIGTVANVLLLGPFIELSVWLLPAPGEWWAKGLMFTAGLVLLAVASGIYIGAQLGAGPRDGLMTGIQRRTGWPLWVGRTGIELTVLLVGWLLGGNVGVGTVAFALLIGPLCNLTLPLLGVPLTKKVERAVEPALA